MNKFNKIIAILSVILIQACALAPIHGLNTARSVGIDKSETRVNVLPIGIGYTKGVTENWDLGMQGEFQAITPLGSVYTRYSFINQPENFSIAGWTGAFYGLDQAHSRGFFVGPIFSYKKSWFEVFVAPRLNWVYWSAWSTNPENTIFRFEADKTKLYYLQTSAGFNLSINERVSINLGAHFLTFIDPHSNSKNTTGILPAIGITARN
jgi:hypothetical protein